MKNLEELYNDYLNCSDPCESIKLHDEFNRRVEALNEDN